MKISHKMAKQQRKLIDANLKSLKSLGALSSPRSGWMKAIRGALGISTRQLGMLLGTTHQVILRQEKREVTGNVTLESLDRAARAMGCRLVYAIVPEAPAESLEALLHERARAVARKLAKSISHSMKLEDQGIDPSDTESQIERLAEDLKTKLDPRLWEK